MPKAPAPQPVTASGIAWVDAQPVINGETIPTKPLLGETDLVQKTRVEAYSARIGGKTVVLKWLSKTDVRVAWANDPKLLAPDWWLADDEKIVVKG